MPEWLKPLLVGVSTFSTTFGAAATAGARPSIAAAAAGTATANAVGALYIERPRKTTKRTARKEK